MARLTPLEGERLLDIGCASGEYTEELAEGFAITDAIDIEPERLELFDKRLGEHGSAHRILITRMYAERMSFRVRPSMP